MDNLSWKSRITPFLDLLDARYLPLLFVAAPQAYTVYAWLLADGAPGSIALMGGIGFEFVYVGAIAWATKGAGWRAARIPAVTALLFSVAVAVAHYAAVSGVLAILHAGFPLVGYAYMVMMHAPVPPSVDAVTQARNEATQAQALATQAASDAAQWREALTQAEQAMTQHADIATQAQAERDALASQVDATTRRLAQTEQALTRAQAERDTAAARADAVAMEIGGKSVSLRRAADALGINETTLRRKMTQAAADVAQAAD
jgi:hypothetical protein